MKERILYVIAFVILASCFTAGVRVIFDVLNAMDSKPHAEVSHTRREQP